MTPRTLLVLALTTLVTLATARAQDPEPPAQGQASADEQFRRRCPQCNRGYTRTERFCGLDGAKLESTGPRDSCPRCQLKARDGDLYCGRCGTDLATTEIRTDVVVEGEGTAAGVQSARLAQQTEDPLASHPWLGFKELAWARYRVTKRTLTTSFAQVDGVHLETWTLGAKGNEGYQLIMKGDQGATNLRQFPFSGDWLKRALRMDSYRTLEASEPYEDMLAVHGRPLRCNVIRQVIKRLRERVELTVHYHPDVPGQVVAATISRSMEGASSRTELRYELVEFDGSHR